MARQPKTSGDFAAKSVNTWGEVIAERAPFVGDSAEAHRRMASVTILAEGVKIDGSGHLPVGITVHCSHEQAEALKAAGQAE